MLYNYKQIVIADDDEDDIAMFKEAVAEVCPAVDVLVAENGVELLSLIDEIPKPNAILLDLNMPLKSGKDCLVEIRAKEEFDIVPIGMLSTSDTKSEIDYCLKKGANHYFVKPHSFEGMKSIVTAICNGVLTQRI
ncbi:response regulator [Segetibacter aerophilus]|uniref:Two-component system response regulator n=1 Tax=Segetibacter aerophilus TaxID=670293 RepID=A0A512BFL0_9BACT|nr:response regulator [Segetibacter aerophilus]GEO10743.1 two-component system response regulator [Segetibacter aerophilus]